jgi:hypothetical protein
LTREIIISRRVKNIFGDIETIYGKIISEFEFQKETYYKVEWDEISDNSYLMVDRVPKNSYPKRWFHNKSPNSVFKILTNKKEIDLYKLNKIK